MKRPNARNAIANHETASAPLLRWVFERRGDRLTCELDARSDDAFEVCLVPHWDTARSVVERFNGAGVALHRHAELVSGLRDAGWMLAEYGSRDGIAPAA